MGSAVVIGSSVVVSGGGVDGTPGVERGVDGTGGVEGDVDGGVDGTGRVDRIKEVAGIAVAVACDVVKAALGVDSIAVSGVVSITTKPPSPEFSWPSAENLG